MLSAHKIAEGDAALAKVMQFMRTESGSLWLFHMQKVDEYYTGGGNGSVSAAERQSIFTRSCSAILSPPTG